MFRVWEPGEGRREGFGVVKRQRRSRSLRRRLRRFPRCRGCRGRETGTWGWRFSAPPRWPPPGTRCCRCRRRRRPRGESRCWSWMSGMRLRLFWIVECFGTRERRRKGWLPLTLTHVLAQAQL